MLKKQIHHLSRNTMIYGFGQVLNRLMGFLLLPLFTLYLSPADYGILAILGLISFVVTSIFSLGITGAAGVCYYSTHGQDCKEQTIWTSFFILAGSTAVIIFCALAFSARSVNLYSKAHNTSLS